MININESNIYIYIYIYILTKKEYNSIREYYIKFFLSKMIEILLKKITIQDNIPRSKNQLQNSR
jgi:hypothetical protein